MDYSSYLAGLFDGEGSFIVTVSLKKRRKGWSIVIYQWADIGLTTEDGKKLLEELAEWLRVREIHCWVKHDGNSTNYKNYTLRVSNILSLIKFCQLLNGELRLKQRLLENFELITRLRQERGSGLWVWSKKHHPRYKDNQLAYEWFEQIAIIWDYAREYEYRGRPWKGKYGDLREKLQVIWRRKFPED